MVANGRLDREAQLVWGVEGLHNSLAEHFILVWNWYFWLQRRNRDVYAVGLIKVSPAELTGGQF